MLSKDNVVGTKVVHALKVYFPVPDPVMYRDPTTKKRIKAELLKGGKGIVITVPAMCTAFIREASVEMIHQQEEEVDDSAALEHKKVASQYKREEGVQYKKIKFLFPGTVECNNRHFNGQDDDESSRKLKTRFRFAAVDAEHVDEDGDKLKAFTSYVWWKMPIVARSESIKMTEDSNSDDSAQAAIRRMANIRMA